MGSAFVGIIVGLIYLCGSALVFVFGSSYFSLFRTNKSWSFKLALVAASGIATAVLLRSDLNPAYGLLAFAFLGASTASILGAAAAHLLHRPLKLTGDDVRAMGSAKAIEAVVVVGSILGLAAAFRVPLASLFMTTGKVGLGLGIGCAGFVLFAAGAWVQGRQLKIPAQTYRRLLPSVLLFVFANGFMEELWSRGLFLGPMRTLVGPVAAILLTGAVFALSHIGATYMKKEERLRFLLILFPLGLAWGACFHFTGSIIAATLFHAGADLMAINGFIAAWHVRKSSGALETP